MAVRDFRVSARGLADLRRAFGRIDKSLKQGLDRHLREAAREVRGSARARAPRKTGRLQGSIRDSVRMRGVSIYSNLEYAPVHEFGGTIKPKGTPIRIEESAFMRSAAEEHTRFIEDELGRLLDSVAHQNGFH